MNLNIWIDFEKIRLVPLTTKWTLGKTEFMGIRLTGKLRSASQKSTCEIGK